MNSTLVKQLAGALKWKTEIEEASTKGWQVNSVAMVRGLLSTSFATASTVDINVEVSISIVRGESSSCSSFVLISHFHICSPLSRF